MSHVLASRCYIISGLALNAQQLLHPFGFALTVLCLQDFLKRYQDLISVSVVALVNAALCDYHVRNCPPSPQLTSVCNKAFLLYHEVEQELRGIEWKFNCTDHKVRVCCLL